MAEPSGASVVSAGTKIIGELIIADSFYIDGEIEGNIDSSNIITIGKNGKIFGTISAKTVIVGGEIKGKIECESCEILSGGRVKGEVFSASLVIEAGGILEGSSHLKSSQTVIPKISLVDAEAE
jgi:cytoskeletal protein CcmA (bactofilin family)